MDWQQIASLVIVTAAAVWLIRTQILAPRRGGGCGGCGSCPSAAPRSASNSGSGRSQLVQIEMNLGSTRRGEGAEGTPPGR